MVRHKHSSRRGWPKQPPPGVLALCQLSALSHSRKCRFNTFKQFVLVLRDPHLLWQPGPSPTCSRISRTNQKQFELKAIASQIEKQPAHHARSTTNVHRATHAESNAHCVNCEANCFKTSDANLLRDSFNLSGTTKNSLKWSHRTIAGVQPSCFTSSRSSTFPESLRSPPLYSIQFAFDQSSTRFQISPSRFQIHSPSLDT